jgi:hypothetical protein
LHELYSVSYISMVKNVIADVPITDLINIDVASLSPVRIPRSYKGQLHLGGKYVFAGTGEHVLFESRLEQDALRFLDHQRDVLHVAAQPLMLKFALNGRPYLHYPDFLVKRAGRPNLLLNVRTQAFLHTDQANRAFGAARKLADALGWDYETWSESPTVLNLNLRFLGGFRFAPYDCERLAPRVLLACQGTTRLAELAQRVSPEALSRPVIFHLLWKGGLNADLSRPLGNHTLLRHPAVA